MHEHGGVLARFHDLIQVTDGAGACGLGQRPILPNRLVAAQQIPPDQIGSRQVLMAGDRDQRCGKIAPRSIGSLVEPPRHVLDEAGLATSRRPLQEYRQTAVVGGLEDLYFIGEGEVIRLAHPG